MKIDRCECLIKYSEYDQVKQYCRGKSEYDEIFIIKDILDSNNTKIGKLLIESYDDKKCRVSFRLLSGEIKNSIIIKGVSELCGIYLLYTKDINYCINLDKDVPLNKESVISKLNIYTWKLRRDDMYFVWGLAQYTDLSNQLERSFLLFCLIYGIDNVKDDEILMLYIKDKFEYYGYNIYDTKYVTKIDFEKKLNSNYFEFMSEVKYTSEWFYNFFYDLFKYLWNLNEPIDREKYKNIGFYNKIYDYFTDFIEIMTKERIIPHK